LNLLESTLEAIVRRNDGVISIQDLMDMELYNDKEVSLSQLEKDKIIELLQSGISKTEVAKKLGIGRATLYRKLLEYELSE
jgi:transcriptional regulator of acetoin/glycerol metabolism